MVLIMVLMVTIIIMVYAIGILTRGSSQVLSAEDQVDHIKAEQLAIGVYAKTYSDLASGGSLPGAVNSLMDNKIFSVSVSSAATGPNNTNTLTITTILPN